MFRIMLEITFMVVIQCGTKAEITKTAKANMLGSQRLILILILIDVGFDAESSFGKVGLFGKLS